MTSVSKLVKRITRSAIPLPIRKRLAVWIHTRSWLPEGQRQWWAQELLRDWEEQDINSFHKFLWFHHLAYAATYETGLRFGKENVKESRRLFFSDIEDMLSTQGTDVRHGIKSIYEVGCSLGYQLRYLETNMFPDAQRLEGVDIDKYAIDEGTKYLDSVGSKVRLHWGDMENLSGLLKGNPYDMIICCGVLMYLKQEDAARVVKMIMRHTRVMAAFTGLAHHAIDNGELEDSVVRPSDNTFIHNIDAMVKAAGAKVTSRRWEGPKLLDGHTLYFIFAQN